MKEKIFNRIPLIVIGAILIIYISFGALYLQKQLKFQSLGSQMLLQRVILQKLPPDIEKLRSQLKDAESEFETTLASLPSSEQGTDIYGVLMDLDRNINANIMSIEPARPIIAKTGEINETILPYSLVVQGTQSDILDFISSLIESRKLLKGLELKSIKIENSVLPRDSSTLNLVLYIHTWLDSASGTQAVSQLSGGEK